MDLFTYLSVMNHALNHKSICGSQSFLDVNQHYIVDRTSEVMINCSELLQPTITGEIETPIAVASVEFIDPREPVLVSLILNTRCYTWHL